MHCHNSLFYGLSFLQGWKTFFEEPVMLVAFVLLGKNLEQRAKLKATSDLTGLLNILPSKARLMVDNDPEQSSFTEVPCDTLSVGDYIVVLPGVSFAHILIQILVLPMSRCAILTVIISVFLLYVIATLLVVSLYANSKNSGEFQQK